MDILNEMDKMDISLFFIAFFVIVIIFLILILFYHPKRSGVDVEEHSEEPIKKSEVIFKISVDEGVNFGFGFALGVLLVYILCFILLALIGGMALNRYTSI
ncbi:MAG: hypothetical protein U9Q22_00825 [Candidatus Altiarchaeota archaeon]|nr:hypothetical protein [Candidatus Altiarchaeota archaeon]